VGAAAGVDSRADRLAAHLPRPVGPAEPAVACGALLSAFGLCAAIIAGVFH